MQHPVARLIASGWRVFATVRRSEDAGRLKTEFGAELIPLILDVTNRDTITVAAEQVALQLQGQDLDGLVNVAGVGMVRPVEYITPKVTLPKIAGCAYRPSGTSDGQPAGAVRRRRVRHGGKIERADSLELAQIPSPCPSAPWRMWKCDANEAVPACVFPVSNHSVLLVLPIFGTHGSRLRFGWRFPNPKLVSLTSTREQCVPGDFKIHCHSDA
jgi:hypothetical protein